MRAGQAKPDKNKGLKEGYVRKQETKTSLVWWCTPLGEAEAGGPVWSTERVGWGWVEDWREGKKAESKIRQHLVAQKEKFRFYSKAKEKPLENWGESDGRYLICTLKNNSEGREICDLELGRHFLVTAQMLDLCEEKRSEIGFHIN